MDSYSLSYQGSLILLFLLGAIHSHCPWILYLKIYLLSKIICNSNINAHHTSRVICRHVQSCKNFESFDGCVPAEIEQNHALPPASALILQTNILCVFHLMPLFLLLYFCAFCCWFPFTRSPGWEAWHQAQNLHNSGRTSLALLFSGFVGHAPGKYGIWFYRDCTPPTISLRLLLCLWMWSIFFW